MLPLAGLGILWLGWLILGCVGLCWVVLACVGLGCTASVALVVLGCAALICVALSWVVLDCVTSGEHFQPFHGPVASGRDVKAVGDNAGSLGTTTRDPLVMEMQKKNAKKYEFQAAQIFQDTLRTPYWLIFFFF